MKSFHCFRCRSAIEWSPHSKVGRRDSCTKCGWDLHICKNCNHYDSTAFRECRENIPEKVVDKEKANFCDLFSPAELLVSSNEINTDRATLLSAAEALFKKKN